MRRRLAVPRRRSTFIMIQALYNYIPSSRPVLTEGRSEKGVAYLRYRAETNGIPWLVDIYSSRFLRVQIGTQASDVQTSARRLVLFLWSRLHVAPQTRANETGDGIR